MALPLSFDGFSCPQAGTNLDLLALLVVDHACAVVDTFLERHADVLASRTDGLSPFLERAARRGFGYGTAWDLAFGDLCADLVHGGTDPARCAAAAALRLLACEPAPGEAAGWSARFGDTARLRFGSWLLPDCDAVEADWDGRGTLTLRTSGPSTDRMGFVHGPAGWNRVDAGCGGASAAGLRTRELIGSDDDRIAIAVAPADALSPAASVRLLHADAYHFERNHIGRNGDWAGACTAAIRLITEGADAYVPWVGNVVRELVPVSARPGIFNSGSERFSPGVVCMSDHAYRWPLAEMLVHEASHQYFHIVNRVGPLDNGADQKLYFSPFRNKDRPVFFILVAYHAFANVLLFYRSARERGLVPDKDFKSGPFADREATLRAQLAAVEPVLQGTEGLTPLGEAMWRPLYERVHA